MEETEKNVLQDISLDLKSGDCLVIIGKIGCGKTSFLYSVMGETILTEGKKGVVGSIAYVEQEPFIISDTVANNILFGKKYDKERFEKAIQAS